MKYLLFFGILFSGFGHVSAQSDTVFIRGNARHYGDSVVLRWNGGDFQSFWGLKNGTTVIEKKNSLEGEWKYLGELKPKAVETWSVSKSNIDKQIILAAASIQQMQIALNTPTEGIEAGMQTYQDLTYLWMNMSLAADLSIAAANLCNLRFADKNPGNSDELLYRVFSKNPDIISDTLYFMLGKELFKPEMLQKPSVVEKENSVELFWKSDKKYTAYFVEKAEKGRSNFQQINRAPLVIPAAQGDNPMLFYYDSVANYKPHDYRIYAIDMFGNRSLYSEVSTGMGRDKTPPPPATGFDVRENLDQTLVLSWDKLIVANGEKGIAVGVKNNRDEPYQPVFKNLLPLGQNKMVYKPISGINDYYFLLQVFDTAGNSSYSEAYYQLNDNTAPSKPSGLKAVVNEKGIVTLSWQWNSEEDLDGYLIYMSNSLESEFGGIVNMPYFDTVFYDTLSLKMLNREVYYKIVAVDKRFNRSENSDIAKVLRPDTLPPVSPIIKSYLLTDSVVYINWIPSSSVDVERHYLYKRNRKSGKLTALTLQTSDTLYRDRNFAPKEEYEYFITAVDASNNVSPNSNTLFVKTMYSPYVAAVKIVNVDYDSLENCVLYSWNYPMENVAKIVIYKGNEIDKVSKMPVEISPKLTSFKDIKIKKNEVYFYAIKLYFKDGKETYLSVPVGVSTR